MKTGIQKVIGRNTARIIQANLKSHNSRNTGESVFIRDFTGRPEERTKQ